MSYITIAQEKKEFITKHLHTIGVTNKGEMVKISLRSTWFAAAFYFILALASIAALLFYRDEIVDFLRTSIFAGADKQILYFVITLILIGNMLWFIRLFNKRTKTRMNVEKDLKTLRILVDYMRIGREHFIEVLKTSIPGADSSEYELFADRVFRLNI